MSSTILQKVWLITGTSSGLGRELARAVVSRGDKVIATARSVEKLKGIQASHPDQCSTLQLDVTDTSESLSAKAKEAMAVWGRIDVLVNNAGHSLFGTVEEAGVEGFKQLYKTNVFGVINVTNAFLPHMRHRRSGTVVLIGSRSGWHTYTSIVHHLDRSFPRRQIAAIHGKQAVTLLGKMLPHFQVAIAEALALELRPHGIRVLNVVPGSIRTEAINNSAFIDTTSLAHPTPDVETGEVPEYAKLRAAAQGLLRMTSGAEGGDTAKAANVIVDVVRDEGIAEGRSTPQSLFLGSDAVRDVGAKCHAVLKNLKEWEDVARSIDVRS